MENLPARLAASSAPRIAKKLHLISGGKILDAATGNGGFIRVLMEALKNYDSFVGIDSSQKAVKAARKRFEGQPVDILVMNAEALEYEDEVFDTVCIASSLHHLSKIRRVLGEMKRVLKSGGYFIIQEMYRDGNQTDAQRATILKHHWNADIDSLMGITHNKTLSRQEIKDFANTLNLKGLVFFDSTHYVACLRCPERFNCDDPKYERLVNQEIKDINNALRRLRRNPKLQNQTHLIEEAKRLKKLIREFGVAEASHLFIIGKK